jgi:hypothetical protein
MKKILFLTAFVLVSGIVSAQTPTTTQQTTPTKQSAPVPSPSQSKPSDGTTRAKKPTAAIGDVAEYFRKISGGTPRDKKPTETGHK